VTDGPCTTLGRPLVSQGSTGCRVCRPIRASARASPARGDGRRFSKKNPPLATGRSLGSNGKVSRFAAALCVAIHTRRGKLHRRMRFRYSEIGPLGTKQTGLTPSRGSLACLSCQSMTSKMIPRLSIQTRDRQRAASNRASLVRGTWAARRGWQVHRRIRGPRECPRTSW
jgi:hypothetical protein